MLPFLPRWHSGIPFSTYDHDNDASSTYNCASEHRGRWWYLTHAYSPYFCFEWRSGSSGYSCLCSNLNGNSGEKGSQGIYWNGLSGSYCNVRYTEMNEEKASPKRLNARNGIVGLNRMGKTF